MAEKSAMTPEKIKELRRRYLAGELSAAGMQAFEERFPDLLPASRGPVGEAVRLGNVTAEGGLKGIANILDIPMAVLQGIIDLESMPFGGRGSVELPTGGARQLVESYGQATGFEPPTTTAERAVSRIGEEVGGAAATAAAGGATLVPQAARRVLGSGQFRTDLGMALGAGTGAAIAREKYPDSPMAEMAGQVGGAGAVMVPPLLLKDVLGRGLLRAIGVKGLTPRDVATQQAFREAGVDPLASDITGRRGVARIEAVPQQFPIGIQPAQEFAERQLSQARTGLEAGIPGIGEQADALGAGLEIQGSAARQATERAGREAAEIAAAGRVAQSMAESRGAEDMVTAGTLAAKNVRAGYRKFQQKGPAFFQEVERLAGDTPVIDPAALKGVAKEIASRSQATGLGGARGASTLQRIGEQPETTLGGVPTQELPENLRRAMMEQLGIDLSGESPITFKQAREIQARLGEMGYRRTTGPGTLNEGDARKMHRAIAEDIDAFLTDPNTDPSLPEKLAEAKQYWATNKGLFKESVNKQVFAKGGPDAEKFIRDVFAPGKVENTLDFKMAVDNDTYVQSTGAFLADLYDRSTVTGAQGKEFLPKKFVALVQPYLKGGHIDVILDPPSAERFKEMVQNFANITPGRVPDLEKMALSSRPEEITKKVFRPGALSDTVAMRTMADPAVFDRSVDTWARQVLRESQTTKAAQTAGEEFLSPSKFVRQVKPLLESGQLEVMYEGRPDIVEQFRNFVDVFERLHRAELMAGNPSGTGQAILGYGQVAALVGSLGTFLGGLATGNLPIAASAVGTASTASMPYALGKFTRSPTGIRLLSKGIEGPLSRYSGPASRFAVRVIGEAISPEEQP